MTAFGKCFRCKENSGYFDYERRDWVCRDCIGIRGGKESEERLKEIREQVASTNKVYGIDEKSVVSDHAFLLYEIGRRDKALRYYFSLEQEKTIDGSKVVCIDACYEGLSKAAEIFGY
jgi:hypothetical protein